MARFLKVHAGQESASDPDLQYTHRLRWINVYTIDEICQGPSRIAVDEDGKLILDSNGKKTFVARTALKVVHAYTQPGHHNTKLEHADWYVDGDPSDWAKTIEAVIAADRFPPEPPGQMVLNDRGTWTAGESYVPLDVAKHPDTDKTYINLKASTSSSSLALKNKEFWCLIDLEADSTS